MEETTETTAHKKRGWIKFLLFSLNITSISKQIVSIFTSVSWQWMNSHTILRVLSQFTLQCGNCSFPTCLVLKIYFHFQTPEAVLQSSAMYPTYDSTCFISSSAVILTSSNICSTAFSMCFHFTVNLTKSMEPFESS